MSLKRQTKHTHTHTRKKKKKEKKEKTTQETSKTTINQKEMGSREKKGDPLYAEKDKKKTAKNEKTPDKRIFVLFLYPLVIKIKLKFFFAMFNRFSILEQSPHRLPRPPALSSPLMCLVSPWPPGFAWDVFS